MLGVVSIQAVLAALVVVLFQVMLERLGVFSRVARFGALGLGLGTTLWPGSGMLFSEVLTALVLLLAVTDLEMATRGSPLDLRCVFRSGGWLAFAVLVRPAHALAAAVFGLALLTGPGTWGRRCVAFLIFGGTASVGVIMTLGLNWHIYGDPLQFGYPAHAEGGKALNTFENPLFTGLLGFLFSPGKSIFFFAPLAVAALVGIRNLWRQRPPLAVIAVGCAALYILFYAGYTQWEGGYCYGPRYLLPVLPLLLLPLATFLTADRSRGTRILVLLLVVGAFVQVPGVFTSFLEEQVGNGGYYDANYDYNIWHQPWLGQTKLLAHYTQDVFRGKALDSELGKGLDLWWLYLRKGGVAWPLILVLLAMQSLLFLMGLRILTRTPPPPPPEWTPWPLFDSSEVDQTRSASPLEAVSKPAP